MKCEKKNSKSHGKCEKQAFSATSFEPDAFTQLLLAPAIFLFFLQPPHLRGDFPVLLGGVLLGDDHLRQDQRNGAPEAAEGGEENRGQLQDSRRGEREDRRQEGNRDPPDDKHGHVDQGQPPESDCTSHTEGL